MTCPTRPLVRQVVDNGAVHFKSSRESGPLFATCAFSTPVLNATRGLDMTGMEKQLQELRQQLHEKVREERRLILEFEATLHSADAELHAEIERIQTSHLERRHAMMASLAGLARSLGALPGGHLESDSAQAIEHEPIGRQIAQDREQPVSVEQITAFTRDLRER